MLVNQLVETVDKSKVLELYCRGADDKLQHAGTYNLDVADSLDALLAQYGQAPVLHSDEYKAYVLVYLE